MPLDDIMHIAHLTYLMNTYSYRVFEGNYTFIQTIIKEVEWDRARDKILSYYFSLV